MLPVINEIFEHQLNALTCLKELYKQGKDAKLVNAFLEAVELIYTNTGRLILTGVGKSGHIARKASATFSSTGTPSIFVHPSEAAHGDMGMITPMDIVIAISNSGESVELLPVFHYCKKYSIKIIGIMQKADSMLDTASNISLFIPAVGEASDVMAPTTSCITTLALCDALAICVHKKRSFTKDDFKIFHPGGKIGANLLRVSELMHTGASIPKAYQDDLLSDGILEMTSKRQGCILIYNRSEEVVGIFTDGDLRRHISSDIYTTRLKDVMSSHPIHINENAFASHALDVMTARSITNLPVATQDGSEIIGIVHLHDILKSGVSE